MCMLVVCRGFVMGEVLLEYLGVCWGYVGIRWGCVRVMFKVHIGYFRNMLGVCWGYGVLR